MFFFFFNDTATTEIYTLSLHDALPISPPSPMSARRSSSVGFVLSTTTQRPTARAARRRCSCLLFLLRLFGKRSLLTCWWVSANRSRKKVLFPDACKPTNTTNSTKDRRADYPNGWSNSLGHLRRMSRICSLLTGRSEAANTARTWASFSRSASPCSPTRSRIPSRCIRPPSVDPRFGLPRPLLTVRGPQTGNAPHLWPYSPERKVSGSSGSPLHGACSGLTVRVSSRYKKAS